MTRSLSENYLEWLGSQIQEVGESQTKSYDGLLFALYEKRYFWLVPHDANRIGDGADLRIEFCHQQNRQSNALDHIGSVSFLEVVIGLSRRLEFLAGGNASSWAWALLKNLKLQRYADPLSNHTIRRIDNILEVCIQRTYDPDGAGGFFPLAQPTEDQTKVEIWYQMAAYISELHPGY